LHELVAAPHAVFAEFEAVKMQFSQTAFIVSPAHAAHVVHELDGATKATGDSAESPCTSLSMGASSRGSGAFLHARRVTWRTAKARTFS